MKNEIFESHREFMQESVNLAMENKVVCDHCGEIKDSNRTISSVTSGTECFDCMIKH